MFFFGTIYYLFFRFVRTISALRIAAVPSLKEKLTRQHHLAVLKSIVLALN